ncbi:MAG: hypothetical protein ACAH11_03095 [Sphingomonas sp.]
MIPIAIVAIAQSAIFAPPTGVPLRIVTERVQGEGENQWRFRMERLVRFFPEGAGYRAEVVLIASQATGPEGTGAAAMLDAGYAGLIGRTMTFHLDGAGRLVSVDDLDAIWGRFCDGVAAIVKTRRPNAEPLVGPLRALPAERRQKILATLVTALVPNDAGEAIGTRPIRLPASSPFGGQVMLQGTRSVERAGITLHGTTRASADVPGQSGATGHVEIEISHDSDPATGLLLGGSETVTTSIGPRRTRRVSIVRVTTEPATPWPAD